MTENPYLDEKLLIYKAQEILKPECTTVHEVSKFCSNAVDEWVFVQILNI
jgi:hypothetical protein